MLAIDARQDVALHDAEILARTGFVEMRRGDRTDPLDHAAAVLAALQIRKVFGRRDDLSLIRCDDTAIDRGHIGGKSAARKGDFFHLIHRGLPPFISQIGATRLPNSCGKAPEARATWRTAPGRWRPAGPRRKRHRWRHGADSRPRRRYAMSLPRKWCR